MKRTLQQNILIVLLFVIFTACDTKQARWKNAESENTIEAYEKFIKDYPKSELVDTARVSLHVLYFQSTKKLNTIESYEDFLNRYPKSAFADTILKGLHHLYYKRAKEMNSIASYEDFFKRYPKSEYTDITRSSLDSLYLQRAKAKKIAGEFKSEKILMERTMSVEIPESILLGDGGNTWVIDEGADAKIFIDNLTNIYKGKKYRLLPIDSKTHIKRSRLLGTNAGFASIFLKGSIAINRSWKFIDGLCDPNLHALSRLSTTTKAKRIGLDDEVVLYTTDGVEDGKIEFIFIQNNCRGFLPLIKNPGAKILGY